MILIDQLEAVIGKGKEGYAWNAQGWYGGDIDRLWFKTEGESSFGERLESVEVQALWSRALDPWWNLQAGVRHDRSEEHTSELQSLMRISYAVFCLKKKNHIHLYPPQS